MEGVEMDQSKVYPQLGYMEKPLSTSTQILIMQNSTVK
jgi:hypothetical protein